MGRCVYVLFGLLLVACPAGAATVASTDYEPVQPAAEIVGTMRVTELLVIPAVQRVLYPGTIELVRYSVEDVPPAGATDITVLSPPTYAADEAAVRSGELIARN